MRPETPLVVFSPLPPRRSGIAAYTAELLAEVGRHRQVVVVVETQADVVETPGALVISQARFLASPWLHHAPRLYQLGNNPDHGYVYRAALRWPGVLMLHDPGLHHMVEELTLGTGDTAGYEKALAHRYGAGGARVARLRQAGLFADNWRYALPLHAQVVDAAHGVLLHSHWAAARLRGTRPVPVRILRHHVSPQVMRYDSLTQAAARAQLELPPDVPVLISLGFVARQKQVPLVLQALAGLRAQGLNFRYLIAGEPDLSLRLPAQVARLGLQDVVRITGWLDEDAFFTHARAADLMVNLRFPQGGESSGTLARALGMGLPALVFDLGPDAEWPDLALYKLRFAANPLPGLQAMLAALLADRPGLAARGQLAQALSRAEASVYRSAATVLGAMADWAGPAPT